MIGWYIQLGAEIFNHPGFSHAFLSFLHSSYVESFGKFTTGILLIAISLSFSLFTLLCCCVVLPLALVKVKQGTDVIIVMIKGFKKWSATMILATTLGLLNCLWPQLRMHLSYVSLIYHDINKQGEITMWANFPTWGPFWNIFPKWVFFGSISCMMLFLT